LVAVGGDQCPVKQAIKNFLACSAFDILGKPADLALVMLMGIGQDGMLGWGELDGHEVTPIKIGGY
jgi:hypothetical protein